MAIAKKMAQPKAKAAAGLATPAVKAPTTIARTLNINATLVPVQAYSSEHAERIVMALYGIDKGSIINVQNPPPSKGLAPKKTQNADFPQKGTRKWVTEYQIYTYAQRLQVGLNKFDYIGLEFVKGGFEEKTPAVKAAKELALKHHLPMMVQIHKVLEKESNVTALAEPDMSMRTYTVEFKTP